MIFSKSFGYAVRGVLYIALMQDEKRYVQVEEIANKLGVPRFFMGKILKRLVKEKMIASSKGPLGGFTITERTLQAPLMDLVMITDGPEIFQSCVLSVRECSSVNPCPLHYQVEEVKTRLTSVLNNNSIADLLTENKPDFIKSIATGEKEPTLDNIINQKIF